MEIPPPAELMERLRALPAAEPLLRRLGDEPDVYLVGGAVRDLLLGGEPSDLDLVVEGDVAAVASRIGDQVVVHDRFGTSTATVEEGFSYDLARARKETYAHPGALPEVAPATLAEDLLRRDFTVNAIAIALGGAEAGRLTHAPGALGDLQAHALRVLHERSFIDDPTRMLRLARYASRLGFAIEAQTRALISPEALKTVSGPRTGTELRLLVAEDDPIAPLRSLQELELAQAVHPQFGVDNLELAERAIQLLPPDARRGRLALALAARGIAAGELHELLDGLAFEAADREAIVATATRGQEVARALASARRPSEIAAAAQGAPVELVALAGALGPAQQASEWTARLRHVELEIDGRDLLAAGVPEGPSIGRGLRAALAAKLDGQARGREAELAKALEAAGGPG